MNFPVKIACALAGWAASVYMLFSYAPVEMRDLINYPVNIGWPLIIVFLMGAHFSFEPHCEPNQPRERRIVEEDNRSQQDYVTWLTGEQETPKAERKVEDKPRLRRPKV